MTAAEASWLDTIDPAHVEALGAWVRGRLRGDEAALAPATAAALAGEAGAVFLGLRRGGALELGLWVQGADQRVALEDALVRARTQLGDEELRGMDTAELLLTHRYRKVNLKNKTERFQLMSNVFRGIRGLECAFSGQTRYVGPTSMIDQNLGWKEVLALLREQLQISEETFESNRVAVRTFDAAQLLVPFGGRRAVALFRGYRVIPIAEVDRAGVERLQSWLGDYLYNNVKEDGRLVYTWQPGRNVEADVPNNMIRQWMATIAMCRTAHYRGRDARLYEIVERNIRFNLRHYYKAVGSLGLIEFGNMVKLGSVALAAIALVEHPKRAEFSRPERKLYAMVEHLWLPTGRFRCFYRPAERDLAHNFYPGEALLAWSYLLDEQLDPGLLAKFMTSYRYYRKWHLENRNPAFVPWHTQAYYKVWRHTKERELVDWIFEMNDWLIAEMQQWDGVLFPDAMGRFYNPQKPYGPPHASSTGVYMEGIIDAFCLARELGDEERRERYRISLLRGLRDCMQLTFWDDDDMFFVRDKQATRGGVRTTVYNNDIRVDNVQHNLMAILKTLQNFEAGDWHHP
jgi:hypothetical protein